MALLGVFIVNAMGHPTAPAYPMQLGEPQAIDSLLAITLQGILVFIVQSKAWPLLSFLFGFSLCELALKARKQGENATQKLRKRYLKLLIVGIAHGVFLYFGDILTMYALAGLIAAAWALHRPAALVAKWKTLLLITAYLEIALVCLAAHYFTTQSFISADYFSMQVSYAEFRELNAKTYWESQSSGVLSLLPIVLMLVVSGILARRFHLLTDRKFAKQFWKTNLGNAHLVIAIAINAALGLCAAMLHFEYGQTYAVSMVATLSAPAGIYLAAAALAFTMRWQHARTAVPAWVVWLAPAGSQTLAIYLASSAALVLSSVYFELIGNTAERLCCVLAGWFVAVALAKAATARGWRDPITRYLGR